MDQDYIDFMSPEPRKNSQFVYSVELNGKPIHSKVSCVKIKSWMKKEFGLKNKDVKFIWRKLLSEKGYTVSKIKINHQL